MNSDEIAERAAYGIMNALDTNPEFREKFKELLNKKDDSDKGIFVQMGWPAKEIDDNKMGYIIETAKKRNEFSFTTIQSMSLSKNLLKSLYKQLGEFLKNENQ